MNESSRKKPRSVKMLVSALAVVMVLCVAPIGSYIFLKGGFKYRLESLNQLQPKTLETDLEDAIAKNVPFEGNARLIHIPGDEVEEELTILHQIDKQIVDRTRFDIVSFAPEPLIEKNKIDFIAGSESNSEFQYILIDTSNVVRGTYIFTPRIGDEIIRHLSVVIPLPEQRSITLNREKK